MTFVFPDHRVVVMHPPRTGSRSRRAVLFSHMPYYRLHFTQHPDVPNAHMPWMDLRKEVQGYKCVALVRHPVGWLRSWWHMRVMMRNWMKKWPKRGEDNIDGCRSSTFEGFVNNYLEQCPGAVGRMFESFMSPHAEDIIVCHSERQSLEVPHALAVFGIQLRNIVWPRVGATSNRDLRHSRLGADLERAICDVESPILGQWYPDLSRS